MKAADEPAYLTVGTDVSAKYRGAFCEAKIKTVKRMVKVKVTLKGESTSQVVQDDQVKGPLRVGSTVEVKTNEGLCSEAVISKLTDASLYTVVFDDGDEKTLRRTSLCLKGERHFAESETLDQLPLTNPEHFGTPVIGKKMNRGGRRSSQAVADEENESSSSEDEEDDRRRLNDELLGAVCSIENVEESSSWFLALVVSPSCNDELVVKKDQCLVRSFGEKLRLPRSAQMFLRSREVSDVWKMDMSQILDSSSSEDEDGEEEKESEEEDDDDDEEKKKKKHIKEEPEEELDPEERDHFLQQLYKFMEDRGTPINKPPVLGYKDLNLFKLFRLVYQLGGCHKIESGTVWKQVYMDLGIPVLNSAASYNVKTAYKKYLYGFEEYCRSASITFRTIHHNNPRPPAPPANQKPAGAEPKEPTTPQVKVEPVDEHKEETESDSESEEEKVKEMQSSPRGRRRCVGSRVKLEREAPSRPEKRGENMEEQQREVRRRSSRRMDDSEKGSDEDEDDEDDEDEESEDEDGDSVTGTKVRVKYGRGKTQKIYEAHIKKTDVDNGEQFYLVHYYGWNVRYDEWVKADRIIWPAEKGSKKRQKKKVKVRLKVRGWSQSDDVITQTNTLLSDRTKTRMSRTRTKTNRRQRLRSRQERSEDVLPSEPHRAALPDARRSEAVTKAEDWPRPAEEPSEERLVGGGTKEPEVHARTPPPAPETAGPAPAEELEPPMGPEALVCHEVDLDDPDEKEKPVSSEHLLLMMREQQAPPPLPHLLHTALPSPRLPKPQVRPFFPVATPNSAPCPEELHSAKSGGEEERGAARAEPEGHKRMTDCNSSPSAKKQKRNQKRLSTPGKVEKNGAGHSSDSEDQSRLSLKSQKSRCPGLSSPSSHSKDKQSFPSPQRTYKWTFQLDELDSMSSTERISFLQEKLQEIRKYYMTLKSEVASIDRRRKRLKKKEREGRSRIISTVSYTT
uniref:ARID domain-containing protein n=1 Tax=Amphiprion ocellaris TaxID=80972 RepID=A0AAQ5ZGK7_AMPOC